MSPDSESPQGAAAAALIRARRADPLNRHIGARLRLRRTLLGLTQAGLAARLGLRVAQIQKYELGRSALTAAALHHLANLLDVPIAYFFEGEGPVVRLLPLPDAAALRRAGEFLHAFHRLSVPRQIQVAALVQAFARVYDEG